MGKDDPRPRRGTWDTLVSVRPKPKRKGVFVRRARPKVAAKPKKKPAKRPKWPKRPKVVAVRKRPAATPPPKPALSPVDRSLRDLPGIDLRLQSQRDLLRDLSRYYAEQPFPVKASASGPRYAFENDCYSYSDGLCLYAMLRHFRPRRFIEIGAGYTSALVLDVMDHFADVAPRCTFIEPYPSRYQSLMRPGDELRAELRVQPMQEVESAIFFELAADDILFVDSSHVDAPGSDVRKLLTEVLPSLASGVLVHFHDMFWPFEYPDVWRGRLWNEVNAVQAFLAAGAPFEILLWNELLARSDRPLLEELMPLALRNPGGSLWLRKR